MYNNYRNTRGGHRPRHRDYRLYRIMDVAVLVGDLRFIVDFAVMTSVSGLFCEVAQGVIDAISGSNGPFAFDFTPFVRHTDKLGLFFKFCANQSVHLSIADAIDVLLIADEWGCPDLVSRLTSYLQDSDCSRELISTLALADLAGDSSPALISLVASYFESVHSSPLFADLSPALVNRIISNPNCRWPSRAAYARFVAGSLSRHGVDAIPLLKHVKLVHLDLSDLLPIQHELEMCGISEMFPDVSYVIELKEKEIDLPRLAQEARKKENAPKAPQSQTLLQKKPQGPAGGVPTSGSISSLRFLK